MKLVNKNVSQKRAPGRPATGHDPVLTLRFPPKLATEVEEWAKRQPNNPSRSEALRRLVEIALKIKDKRK
jgi:hypothetical protein